MLKYNAGSDECMSLNIQMLKCNAGSGEGMSLNIQMLKCNAGSGEGMSQVEIYISTQSAFY